MQTENSKNCVHICTTVCTSAQSDQALHCLPAKLLDIVERKGPDEIAGTDSDSNAFYICLMLIAL